MNETKESIKDVCVNNRLSIGVLAAIYFLIFATTFKEWLLDCWELDDFSHCLLIPVISGYILWTLKDEISRYKITGGKFGLFILLASIGVFFYGYGYSWNIFQRIGLVGVFIGLVGFIFGTKFITSQFFPLFYLIFAIPIPFVVYGKISRFLRGMVTTISASILQVMNIPAYNEGNILVVGDYHLGVVDACSGIRSIMAILSIAILFTYLFKSGVLGGILLASLTLPVAVAMNIVRVLTMAIALHQYNLDLTEGTLHDVLGFFIFSLIITLMYLSWRFIKWLLYLEDQEVIKGSPA